MQCDAVCCSVMQCDAVCCSVLQCVAVCCSVLQRVAMCFSVLQRVAACCSVTWGGVGGLVYFCVKDQVFHLKDLINLYIDGLYMCLCV